MKRQTLQIKSPFQETQNMENSLVYIVRLRKYAFTKIVDQSLNQKESMIVDSKNIW